MDHIINITGDMKTVFVVTSIRLHTHWSYYFFILTNGFRLNHFVLYISGYYSIKSNTTESYVSIY